MCLSLVKWLLVQNVTVPENHWPRMSLFKGDSGSPSDSWTVSEAPPSLCFYVQQVDEMQHEATSGGALTPVQQMVASGSGVLLTSLFGEFTCF